MRLSDLKQMYGLLSTGENSVVPHLIYGFSQIITISEEEIKKHEEAIREAKRRIRVAKENLLKVNAAYSKVRASSRKNKEPL